MLNKLVLMGWVVLGLVAQADDQINAEAKKASEVANQLTLSVIKDGKEHVYALTPELAKQLPNVAVKSKLSAEEKNQIEDVLAKATETEVLNVASIAKDAEEARTATWRFRNYYCRPYYYPRYNYGYSYRYSYNYNYGYRPFYNDYYYNNYNYYGRNYWGGSFYAYGGAYRSIYNYRGYYRYDDCDYYWN